MRSFRRHLDEKLKDERFRRLYDEERQLTELPLKMSCERSWVFRSRRLPEERRSHNSNCQRLRMGSIVI